MIDLAQSEVDAFLRRQLVGRVGCHSDGSTYVVPVIYVWDGDCVYVQSMEGRKIEMMRRNPEVCFEVDEYAPDGSWCSVILRGVYEELGSALPREVLDQLVQRFAGRGGARRQRSRLDAGRRAVAFRIRCLEATGRRVHRGDEELAAAMRD